MRYLVQPVVAASANMPWLTSGKVYTVISVSAAKVLTVRDERIELEQRDWDENPAQQWRIEALDGDDLGYYRIVSVDTGKVLDIRGGSSDNGAALIAWDWHGGPNQQFSLSHLGDGRLKIVARHSGRAADVAGASPDDGAPVIQWDWHGGPNQQWQLATVHPASVVEEADRPVVVYEHANYEGRSQSIGIGSFPASAIDLPDNSISSVRVPEGRRVTLFEHDHFRAGLHHRCWGVDDRDRIWTRDADDGDWQRVDGALRRVAVAADGRVWGVNAQDHIYTREGVGGTWQRISGRLTDVAVNADGRVWGVNAQDHIFTRSGVEGGWQHVVGALRQIAVADDGRVWGVNAADRIWTRDGVDGSWQAVPGRLRQLSVDASGRVWGVNAADRIWTRDGVDGSWEERPGRLRWVSVASDGTVWGANAEHRVYNWSDDENRWRRSAGRLTQIAASSGSQGRSRSFDRDTGWVGDDFNDRASSILVEPVATLFEHHDYQGQRSVLGVGRYRRGQLGLPDGTMSAIRVPFGLSVTVFDGPDFDGTARIFTEDVPALTDEFNDAASSVVVKATGVSIPGNAIRFGQAIAFTTASGTAIGPDPGGGLSAGRTEIGTDDGFVVTRTGPTKLPTLLSFGDVVSLGTAAWTAT